MAIFACFLIYYNMKLLGEFFFVTLMAGVTSLWLRRVNDSIVMTIEKACSSSYYFIDSTFWYQLFANYLIPLVSNGGKETMKKIKSEWREKMDKRKKNNTTIFNNMSDTVIILLVYIGWRNLGWSVTLLVSFYFSLASFAAMFVLDILMFMLHYMGYIESDAYKLSP